MNTKKLKAGQSLFMDNDISGPKIAEIQAIGLTGSWSAMGFNNGGNYSLSDSMVVSAVGQVSACVTASYCTGPFKYVYANSDILVTLV